MSNEFIKSKGEVNYYLKYMQLKLQRIVLGENQRLKFCITISKNLRTQCVP